MVRYADDFVILCRSEGDAQRALALVQQWTTQAGLTLHPEKTRIVDATKHGGFDFLGYHFERGYKWPRQKSLKKLKDKIRVLTKRNNGHRLQVIIAGALIASREAGTSILNTASTQRSGIWTPGYECACGAFCASVLSAMDEPDNATINFGQMLSLRRRGCSLLHMPMRWRVNPLGGEPQPESRMREIRQSGSEGGGAKPIASPYPYL
jgi:Reverse transcriptase (RNA-dependent DNA polymerase)